VYRFLLFHANILLLSYSVVYIEKLRADVRAFAAATDLDEEKKDVEADADDDDATASSTHLIQADITFVVGLLFM